MKRIPEHMRGRRILGLTFGGRAIVELPAGSSLIFAAAGGGKTTCASVPMVNHPHSAAVAACRGDPCQFPFVTENIAHTLIDEPKDDSRNSYWRQSPREIIDLGIRTASRKPEAPTNAERPRKAGVVE